MEAGLLLFYAASAMQAASVEEEAGDDEQAETFYRNGFDRLAELGEHGYASQIAADLARTLLRLGRLEEVERWVKTARDLCPPGDVGTLISADIGEGLLRTQLGRLDDAERLVRRALELAETTDFWAHRAEAREALAAGLAAQDPTPEAKAALETAVEIYEAKGAVVAEQRARGLLAEL